MILALFAFRLRPDAHGEFEHTVARMVELVGTIPGFISMDLFRAEDGRTLAVPRFESEEALLTWRNHPEHLKAQQRGIDVFFEDYWIDVCSTIRSYEYHRQQPSPAA
jgi:heme-degrading monooxygenase HmoA